MLIAGRRIGGIGLGTAQFAFRDGTFADSVATVHAALDAGVRLIDTALAYTRPGIESYAEQVIASALRGVAHDRPLVATKGGHWRDGDQFPVDGRPEALPRTARSACGRSRQTGSTSTSSTTPTLASPWPRASVPWKRCGGKGRSQPSGCPT